MQSLSKKGQISKLCTCPILYDKQTVIGNSSIEKPIAVRRQIVQNSPQGRYLIFVLYK